MFGPGVSTMPSATSEKATWFEMAGTRLSWYRPMPRGYLSPAGFMLISSAPGMCGITGFSAGFSTAT